jgi:MFS family permease
VPKAVTVVAVLCLAFVMSQFYRTSVGVIGPELMRSLGLSAEALGTLGGTFFLVFGLCQIPLGVLLDRYGPRRVNAALLAVAALGALVFAAASNAALLTLGRGMMGLGCAAALMGSLVVYSRWFPRHRFSGMAGLTLSVGGLGALISTAPLALAAEALGWRGAFVGAAALTFAFAALVWLVVRDAPPGKAFHEHAHEPLGQVIRGVGTVLANRELHRLLPLSAVAYASMLAVLGLWGAPYLTDVHGLDVVAAANILMGMAVTMMVGSLAYGWIAPRFGTYKWLVLAGAGGVVAIYALLALLPPLGGAAIALLIGLAGLLGSYSVLLISHVRSLFPDRLVGRGLTAANLFNFVGVGLVQVGSTSSASAWSRWRAAGSSAPGKRATGCVPPPPTARCSGFSPRSSPRPPWSTSPRATRRCEAPAAEGPPQPIDCSSSAW